MIKNTKSYVPFSKNSPVIDGFDSNFSSHCLYYYSLCIQKISVKIVIKHLLIIEQVWVFTFYFLIIASCQTDQLANAKQDFSLEGREYSKNKTMLAVMKAIS